MPSISVSFRYMDGSLTSWTAPVCLRARRGSLRSTPPRPDRTARLAVADADEWAGEGKVKGFKQAFAGEL
jgi:hypothetical protein